MKKMIKEPTSRMEEISNFFLNSDISMNHLMAQGCNNTNVNVYKSREVIRMVEKRWDRFFYCISCLLDIYEVLVKHSFQHIDATKSGAQKFSEAIGKELENCVNEL